MKTVAEVAQELFPNWTWDSKDAMCEDMEKLAITFAKVVIDEILQDNSMIYVELDGEANYSYEAFEKFKQQIL